MGKKPESDLLLPFVKQNLPSVIHHIKDGFFSDFDATLGDTHCQNRAFIITHTYPQLINHISAEDFTISDARIKSHIDLALEGATALTHETVMDNDFHLLNIVLLHMLHPSNVKQHLFGVLVHDISKSNSNSKTFSNSQQARLKAFLMNASHHYLNHVLYHDQAETIPYEYINNNQKISIALLPFYQTVEHIITASDALVLINSRFNRTCDSLTFTGPEFLSIHHKTIISDVQALQSKKPYIVFHGYSINTEKTNAPCAQILTCAKNHPQSPADKKEHKIDMRLIKKDESFASMENTPFVVSHVSTLSGEEIFHHIQQLSQLKTFPFTMSEVEKAQESVGKYATAELASCLQSKGLLSADQFDKMEEITPQHYLSSSPPNLYIPLKDNPSLMTEDYILSYFESQSIQAHFVDFDAREYPDGPLIMGTSQFLDHIQFASLEAGEYPWRTAAN